MIPQTTTPLTKSIRTLEGWLVIAANIALVVVPIVTTALPPELAAKLAAGLDAVYAVSRGIVKALSTTPQTPAPFSTPNVQTSSEAVSTAWTHVPSPPSSDEILGALHAEDPADAPTDPETQS